MNLTKIIIFSFLTACFTRYIRVSLVSSFLIINYTDNMSYDIVSDVIIYGTIGSIIVDTIIITCILCFSPYILRMFFKQSSLEFIDKMKRFIGGQGKL